MSAIDTILARSRRPGRFVEHRRFTLSREQALSRLRGATLRHPAWYLLELVQAAVFAEADYLAVESRPGTLRVAWVGGRALLPREVEELFDHLSGDRTDPERRHLVHLAHGMSGLLRRRPRRVRLETGDGRQGVRMDLDRQGGVRVGPIEEPVEGTCLVARFRDAWLQRLGGEPWLEEQGLVEERCQYAPVPILLDGHSPFGYRGDAPIEIFGARHQRSFARDGRRGVVALAEPGQLHSGFRVVIGGVWVATLPLRFRGARPLVGVLCDDALTRTADGAGIVDDSRFRALLELVQQEATALLAQVEGSARAAPTLSNLDTPLALRSDAAELLPLPRRVRGLGPRGILTTTALLTPRDRPLYWCAPEDVARLLGPADPVRLPCAVAVLRPADLRALAHHAPALELRQLRDALDVELALRRLDDAHPVVERRFEHEEGRVRLRFHPTGALPDWGEGLPFAVVRDGRTVRLGGIRGDRVLPTGSSGPRGHLERPLELPRVSLVLEGVSLVDDALAQRVRVEAAQLVHGLRTPVPTDLLAALLVCWEPHFVGDPPRLIAHPPPGAPRDLAALPLLGSGGPTLEAFVARLGTEDVLPVDTAAQLAALAPLERRFGWGHLGHPSLDGRPVWAVGRIGDRWLWLERPELLRAPAITQRIQVGANLAPPRAEGWTVVERPHPAVSAVQRDGIEGEDWARGWELLLSRLRRAALDDGWPVPLTPVSTERARALGRLALLALAARRRTADRLLRPTDGSAFRSLASLRDDPRVRAVARGGVQTRDEHVLELTLDELRAVAPAAPLLPLDLGAVALDDPDGAAWLERFELRGPGLRARFGLEHPYRGGCSLLVRTTTGLRALPALELPGLHALLEPTPPRLPRDSELRLLELGLADLPERLELLQDRGLDPDRAETARLHAMATVLVAWRRGPLAGSTLDLARRTAVLDATGGRWGSLAEWLSTSPSDRPPLPAPVASLAPPASERPALPAPVHARLAEIVADAGLKVRVSWIHDGRGPPVRVSEDRSSPTRVVLLLDRADPAIARAAVEPGRPREVVLLECARRLAAWGRSRGLELDLPTLQRLLLARRLQEPR